MLAFILLIPKQRPEILENEGEHLLDGAHHSTVKPVIYQSQKTDSVRILPKATP